MSEPRWRKRIAMAAAAAAAGFIWAVAWGPLAGRTGRIDAEWLAVLAAKDYLFADAWPASMWLVAGVYVAVVLAVFLIRRAAGVLHARETGLAVGALVLAGIFLATLPLVTHRIALAVQLQISRLFWMLDVLGTIYLVWAVAEGPPPWAASTPRRASTSARRARLVAGIVMCAAIGRGTYVMWVEHPGRPVAELSLPRTDWQDAMDWLKATPTATHVLADPGHAWRYGTSVRVAALRDVYLEEVKDAALAIYSRPVAMRVAERTRALDSFDALTPQSARDLARRFEIDYLVSERTLDLPIAYRNARFIIYRLR